MDNFFGTCETIDYEDNLVNYLNDLQSYSTTNQHIKNNFSGLEQVFAEIAYPVLDGVPECQVCGCPQSRNPHPEAGKPNADPWLGYQWECIPCLAKRSSNRYDRLLALKRKYEQTIVALEDAKALLNLINGDLNLSTRQLLNRARETINQRAKEKFEGINIAQKALDLADKNGNDCVLAFCYASAEALHLQPRQPGQVDAVRATCYTSAEVLYLQHKSNPTDYRSSISGC